ncbi:MAG: MarR family transcriptional regulator [Rubrivivax sp.]|nr:MAG: MarR family transcriptional regulator [Rubrivivax sp.]
MSGMPIDNLVMTHQKTPRRPTPRRQLKLGVLRDNMGFLSRVLRNMAVQSAEAYVGELDLAAGQLTMLGLISANEGVEQNEIARVMLMRKSQVTTLIQDLVSRGFVTREEHGADRRYLKLGLTPEGEALWQRAAQLVSTHSEMLLGVLDEPEQAQLVRLVKKMLASHLSDVGIDLS